MSDSLTALGHWLKTVQGSPVDPAALMTPARTATPISDVIRDVGADKLFDTEPQRYYQLLRALAPGAHRRD